MDHEQVSLELTHSHLPKLESKTGGPSTILVRSTSDTVAMIQPRNCWPNSPDISGLTLFLLTRNDFELDRRDNVPGNSNLVGKL